MLRIRHPFVAIISLMVSSACASSAPQGPDSPGAASPTTAERPLPPQDAEDPYIWLEEVEGEEALAWVEARNAATVAELEASPVYQPIFDRTVEILDSQDRIAYPSILGDRLYNFWQDAEHPRGIWRRTSWESYLSGNPGWETVLDIDALALEEDVPWSFGGGHLPLARL